jgi:hypothetical protein
MALTTEQEVALYDILEVPYSTTVNKLQPADNLTAVSYTSDTTTDQAYAKIQTKITEIEANASLLAVLVAYLDEWIALGTNVATLEGGIGGVNGISVDPTRQRREIRAKVINIVPFYRHHDEMIGNQKREISSIIHG